MEIESRVIRAAADDRPSPDLCVLSHARVGTRQAGLAVAHGRQVAMAYEGDDIMRVSGVFSTGQAQSLEGATVTPSSESYCLIPLTQGQFAKVDAADYEWLSHWKWHASWAKNTQSYYAVRQYRRTDGRQRLIRMHRSVLALEPDDARYADHINRDTLDNRRSNLRLATSSQNNRNRRAQSSNTSGYKGVSFSKSMKLWTARIAVNNKRIYLGARPTAEAAYRELYVPAAITHHGEFASL